MHPRAILFDIGNTLVSYPLKMRWPGLLEDTLALVSANLAQRGLAVPPLDEIHLRAEAENHEEPDFRVRPLSGRLARIYGLDPANPILEELCFVFCRPLVAVGQVYADTIPTLETLRHLGYRLGAVSNLPWGSPSAPWRAALAAQGIARFLDALIYCADVGWRKPAAQPFLRALEQLRVKPQECLFVGDDPRWDLVGPRALGMPAILLDRSGRLELPGEKAIASLDDLLAILNAAL